MKHFIEVGQEYKTNSYGAIKIVERLEKGHFRVQFVDTGYTVTAHRGNIVAGKVRDSSAPNSNIRPWEDVDVDLVSNSGLKFKMVRRNAKKCIVVFEDTGYTTEAYVENVLDGKITDPYAKSVLGVGYPGEFERVPYWKKGKQLWSNMMKRCYNPKDLRGYYGRCFVDERWKCFANFLEDLPKLENFNEWLDHESTGIKYNLDKDTIIPNNNVYSRLACMFLEESINKGLTSRNNYGRD